LLNAMFQNRAWSVETSTAQSEIIGAVTMAGRPSRREAEAAAARPRELFDTLLLWKAQIVPDANGEAVIEVPLNDSLTSFRLVAVADEGTQRFGTGSASIRVTQDLQVLSGLPPLVRDGDQFSAMLTLRNTTAREMKMRVTLAGIATAGVGSVAPVNAAGPPHPNQPSTPGDRDRRRRCEGSDVAGQRPRGRGEHRLASGRRGNHERGNRRDRPDEGHPARVERGSRSRAAGHAVAGRRHVHRAGRRALRMHCRKAA
jgi:hypothetical protein